MRLELEKLMKEKEMSQIDMGVILWPESSKEIQRVNASRLVTGKTQALKLDFIEKLCTLFDCSPNKLFGYEKK